MTPKKVRHLLTGEEFTRAEAKDLLDLGDQLRNERLKGELRNELSRQNLLLLFDKPSLRTRISFSVAMAELGGNVIESVGGTRKKEEPEDVAGVLSGYGQGIVLRTHDHSNVTRMASKASIPVINGLSDSHHPCQVFADLLTLKQYFRELDGLKLAYVGDGNNMLNSILLLMPFLGVHVTYACPQGFEPNAFIVKQAKKRAKEGGGSITAHSDPTSAVKGANAVYTDVWTSMGFEEQEHDREEAFADYQLNESLYAHAAPGALIMHCMPMVRGKEISETLADHENAVLFRQSENRMHIQKAILLALMKG